MEPGAQSDQQESKRECNLFEEIEVLREHLEDAESDLKPKSDALTQTILKCNIQVTTLKSDFFFLVLKR